MASRNPDDLYEPLRKRWEWMRDEWKRVYPDKPQPFLTATKRSMQEQADLFLSGDSLARPGHSLHNFEPAYAFDVAFDPDPTDGVGNDVTWVFEWYQRWGELAESIGLEWGGRWPNLVDGPHVQMPMTWEEAEMKQIPELPPLPDQPEIWGKLVIMRNGAVTATLDIAPTDAIVTRMDTEKRRYYVDVKSEE